MYNLYLSLESMLSEINLSINAINKNDDMIDILTPTYRFYVRKSQYKTKLKEFVDIYDQFLTLNPNKKNFKIIDLRYPTGFAVQ